jgi:hypothetical protein
MTEPKPQNTTNKLLKTIRQWLGFAVVLTGAFVLLLESFAVIPG